MRDKVVFDTNVFIDYPVSPTETDYLSSVVVQELTAGGYGEEKDWERVYLWFEARQRMLVPTAQDWWFAGKILSALLRGQRTGRNRQALKIDKEEQRRLVRDTLIARTVKSVNATLITRNVKDFEKIKRFCNVKLSSSETFFGFPPS